MKFAMLPKSTSGKWSIGLIGGLVLFFALLALLAASGQRGGKTFSDNLALAVPGLLAAISGIAAFFTGIVSIIFHRERSVAAYLATIIGLFVLLFCLGEILSPH